MTINNHLETACISINFKKIQICHVTLCIDLGKSVMIMLIIYNVHVNIFLIIIENILLEEREHLEVWRNLILRMNKLQNFIGMVINVYNRRTMRFHVLALKFFMLNKERCIWNLRLRRFCFFSTFAQISYFETPWRTSGLCVSSQVAILFYESEK